MRTKQGRTHRVSVVRVGEVHVPLPQYPRGGAGSVTTEAGWLAARGRGREASTLALGAALLLSACGARTELPIPNATTRSPGVGQGPGASCGGAPCGRAVLFGGDGLDDTWVFDGTNWSQVLPSTSPPARIGGCMAAVAGKLVLFGGAVGGVPEVDLDDTWTFDGSEWVQAVVSHAPRARSSANMVSMPGKAMLYGGDFVGAGSGIADDTWLFDGATWTEATGATPPLGYGEGAMASLGAGAVLFEDFALSSAGSGSTDPNIDTWLFDGGGWSQADVSSSPLSRWSASMAALGQAVILFGGWDLRSRCLAPAS